jgi:hypothetical protein
VEDALGERAVPGEQEQAVGVGVQAADRVEPQAQELGGGGAERVAAVIVVDGRQDAERLVEQRDLEGRRQLAAVEDERVGGRDLGGGSGDDLAVHRDEAVVDGGGSATAGQARAVGDHGVEARHAGYRDSFRRRRSATAATFSAVKPNSLASTLAGAEAP